jgi:futalosine hydrolase
LVVNAGIAGSLTDEIGVGEVVNVVEEEFADVGIEEEYEFLTLFDSGYLKPDEFPFENRLLKAEKLPYMPELKRVKAITTNTSHSRKSSISQIKGKFTAQIESMEGAALFYVCRWASVPCIQIRSVSNYVAPAESACWDIPLALDNLNKTLHVLFTEFQKRFS